MQWLSYLLAIPVLAVIVLIHEAGHYIVARRERLAVPEFSIGFGPRLGSFRAWSTEWTLRPIPLGGYCRFAEEGSGSWHRASPAARARVMLAGPLANFALFAFLLPVVAWSIGTPWAQIPPAAVRLGQLVLTRWLDGMALLLHGGVSGLAGPVGITGSTAQAVGLGGPTLLFYVAGLSLNLGLFNLFPLPVLDGGRLLLLGVEWARRRPLRPEVEEWIYAGGAVAMLALVVLLVAKDIWTLIVGVAA